MKRTSFLITILLLCSCSTIDNVLKTNIKDVSYLIKYSNILKKSQEKIFKINNPLEFPMESLGDEPVLVYAKKILFKLSKVHGDESSSIEIKLLRTDRVQAMGGYDFIIPTVTITRGMLNMIQDEDELACLIGHEIGHIVLKHQFRINENNPASKFVSNHVGDVIKNEQLRLEMVKQQQAIFNSGWGKALESEADRFGSDLAAKAGYDPYALCDVFERLSQRVNMDMGYRLRKIKGSHPSLDVRAANLKKYLISKGYSQRSIIHSTQEYQKAMLRLWGIGGVQGQINNKVVDEDLRELNRISREIQYAKQINRPLGVEQFLTMMTKISDICRRANIKREDLIESKEISAAFSKFMEENILQDTPTWGSRRLFVEPIANRIKDVLAQATQIGVGSIPVVGNAISLYEVLAGKDFFNGESLSIGQRTFSAVCVFVGSGHLWKDVAKGIQREIGQKLFKQSVKEINEIEKSVVRAAKDIEEGIEHQIKFRKGEDVNAELRQRARNSEMFENPYPSGGTVIEYSLAKDVQFVRVHVKDNVSGVWVIKKADILGKSPEEVQKLYALPVRPAYISDVILPKGTKMRVGFAGENKFSPNGGNGLQYEIIGPTNDDWYLNTRSIGEVIHD